MFVSVSAGLVRELHTEHRPDEEAWQTQGCQHRASNCHTAACRQGMQQQRNRDADSSPEDCGRDLLPRRGQHNAFSDTRRPSSVKGEHGGVQKRQEAAGP